MSFNQQGKRWIVLLILTVAGVLAHETAEQLGEGLRATQGGQAARYAEESKNQTTAKGTIAHVGGIDWNGYSRGGFTGSGSTVLIEREYALPQRLGSGKENQQVVPPGSGAPAESQQAAGERGTVPGDDRGNVADGDGYHRLGTYLITAYTNGYESTGKRPGDKGYGITSSGVHTKEGVTVAADPNVLPIGSRVYIEGVGERVVQDTGGKVDGKHLDLFIEDLDEALEWGTKSREVYLIEKGDGSL